MNNFTFYSPTKIIFGKNTELAVGSELKKFAKKVLLHYGGGSIKSIGLYQKVINSLNEAGIEFVELSGVKPNPVLSLVKEGIELCRKENVDMILAVGGGSVIDSAKAIALGVKYEGDVWDFYMQRSTPTSALPVATILTIPAAGSESSPNSVITDGENKLKIGFKSDLIRPVFSILNPEVCYSLPDNQIANGVCDIMCHIMERYFTPTLNTDLTDRLCEGALRSIILNAKKVKENKQNYDAFAEIMWGSTLAHNGLLGTGREEDWASHRIEHQLSAFYDVAHGAGLAVIYPAWMKYVYKYNINIFMQFAVRVFDVDISLRQPEDIALEGISRLEKFFEFMGLPTRLSHLNIDGKDIDEMSKRAVMFGSLGAIKKLDAEDVKEIYKLAL